MSQLSERREVKEWAAVAAAAAAIQQQQHVHLERNGGGEGRAALEGVTGSQRR